MHASPTDTHTSLLAGGARCVKEKDALRRIPAGGPATTGELGVPPPSPPAFPRVTRIGPADEHPPLRAGPVRWHRRY